MSVDEAVLALLRLMLHGERRAWKGFDWVVLGLPAHKVIVIRERIEAAGARLLYLPGYSPDFIPIELAFAKLKAILHAEPLARSATSGTPSNEPSDASPQPNAAAISPPQATTHMIQPDWMPL